MSKWKNNLVCIISISIMGLAMLTIIARVIARQLIARFAIQNGIVDIILFDAPDLLENSDEESKAPVVDWESIYPFEEGEKDTKNSNEEKSSDSIFAALEKRVLAVEEQIRPYITNNLMGYLNIVQMAKQYERIIQWGYISYNEYNGVIELSDGQLTSFQAYSDTNGPANKLIEFRNYCEEKNIEFLYVQAPYKICKVTDSDISGTMDFSNQMADDLLNLLSNAEVHFFDCRAAIHQEGLDHHSLFYRTDHHWRAETGLWAAEHILKELHSAYHYEINEHLLSAERFRKEDYPAIFLGSRGRKVTLALTTPDYFSLLYPDYETSYHYEIPEIELGLDGDFSILYDLSQVERVDYYNLIPYDAHIYGDRALEIIENKYSENNLHILFIHDSFGICVAPFLSLGVKRVDAIDPRLFTGSIKNYIETEKPDIVIALYNPDGIKNAVLYDFR